MDHLEGGASVSAAKMEQSRVRTSALEVPPRILLQNPPQNMLEVTD